MINNRPIDTSLAFAFVILVLFGIAMVSSVSVYESYQLTEEMVNQGYLDEPSNGFYLWRHFQRVVIAIPLFLLGMVLPLTFWKKAALPLFIISWLLLIALFIPGIGATYGSANSWIDLPFLPSIQPVEMVKLGLIFYLAVWMEKRQEVVRSFQYGFIPFTILLSMVVVLLAMQPDFGSVLVITSIATVMLFAAGGSSIHITLGGFMAAAMAYPIIMSREHVYKRFVTFLNPEIDPLGIGFQIKQALIAIGSGGVFGVGFGKSIQKFGYLPEVQGDTIFAATAEELGFIRMTFVVCVYAFIAYRGYYAATHAKDRFSMLVAVGITSWFAFQTIINMGVNLSLLPLTGITLPFVSYGGSSMLSNMLGAGILLNISRDASGTSPLAIRRHKKSQTGRSSQLRRRLRP